MDIVPDKAGNGLARKDFTELIAGDTMDCILATC